MSASNSKTKLDAAYTVGEAQVQAYAQVGHVLLRGVCPKEEVAGFRPQLAEAIEALHLSLPPIAERDTYGKAFIQMMNLWTTHTGVREFVMARRFAKIAADLMGVAGVRIYHDQALFKEPGGGHTPWHQDQYYWPLDTDNMITMWLPLTDIPVEAGIMNFASGSHRDGYLSALDISDKSEEVFDTLIRERGFNITRGVAMNAGDATFHAGWTLHSAPPNNTDYVREVMTIIYLADGARVIEPDHQDRRNDLERWLPGAQPGDLAATALNPLVFP